MFLTSKFVPFATCQAVNPKELLRIWEHLWFSDMAVRPEPLGVFLKNTNIGVYPHWAFVLIGLQ